MIHTPPAGGHAGPPLRILTNGSDGRKRLIRHRLRRCHLPLKGKAGTAGASPRPTRCVFRGARRLGARKGQGAPGFVAPHADGASRMPRPTSSAPFVGADVLIGPRAATWGRPYENFDPLLPVGADLRVRPPVLGAHCAPLHGGGGSPLPPLAFGHLPLIGGVVPRPTWFASSVGADLCVRPAKATPPCLTAWGCIMSCDRWGPLTPAWRR